MYVNGMKLRKRVSTHIDVRQNTHTLIGIIIWKVDSGWMEECMQTSSW